MKQKNSMKETFREGSGFQYFLLCILITGLSYGLYKGMLDNYLAEVVQMGEMDRGITEFSGSCRALRWCSFWRPSTCCRRKPCSKQVL